MLKRKLEELNLMDDFLFGTMVAYPKIGEEFVREILRTIFQRDFGRLTIVPQKVYYGTDTDKHGVRLDVYLEENLGTEKEVETATIYDVEPDQNDRSYNRKHLPRRTRFYHAKIDAECLKAGDSYKNLKNVVVIMITSYDPFDEDHMIYTVRNKCEELPDLPYDDGARTIYLYTKGTKGNPSQQLRDLLHYMEHTTVENAGNESLKKVQELVDKVKYDGEVSIAFMKIFEREEMLREEGREEGRREEQANTEREKRRADRLEAELRKLRMEIKV